MFQEAMVRSREEIVEAAEAGCHKGGAGAGGRTLESRSLTLPREDSERRLFRSIRLRRSLSLSAIVSFKILFVIKSSESFMSLETSEKK